EPVIRQHKINADEYARIEKSLGRAPTYTELGVVSVMWSEHCSYKSSRVHLSRLPTKGRRVIQGPGENAGVVDIGDGFAAVFKMESHNHPSFIEPYQGAATGVGGILRDVFTMGARPIASLNSLRFGRADHPRTAELLRGVVAGIGGYGNSIGVPTVGGEVQFDPSYDGNILVNAFTCGVARTDRIFYGRAAGIGNPVLYVGAKTGRDGIHGATMASDEFSAEGPSRRPTVQVGDPFMEKVVIGRVTDTGRWIVRATPGYDPFDGGTPAREPAVACNLPVSFLADAAPKYDRPRAADPFLDARRAFDPRTIPAPRDVKAELLA